MFIKPVRWILTKLFANEKQPYLKEIGVKNWPGNHFGGIDTFGSLRNAIKCKRTKKKVGLDPRDCWNLDSTFYDWLYTHLVQLLKDTNCDLNWRTYEHNGNTYTEGEYIQYLMDLCKQVILFDEFKDTPEINWEMAVKKEPDKNGFNTVEYDLNEEKLKEFRSQVDKNYEEKTAIEKEIFDVFYELHHALWW